VWSRYARLRWPFPPHESWKAMDVLVCRCTCRMDEDVYYRVGLKLSLRPKRHPKRFWGCGDLFLMVLWFIEATFGRSMGPGIARGLLSERETFITGAVELFKRHSGIVWDPGRFAVSRLVLTFCINSTRAFTFTYIYIYIYCLLEFICCVKV